MIVLRVDMNASVASGHMMRCLSVADALRDRGMECLFVTADHTPDSFIVSRGFRSVVIDVCRDNPEQEAQTLKGIIRSFGAKLLIIDSYRVTEKFLAEMTAAVKTVYIDDLGAFDYPVDGIVNYNVYADQMGYRDRGGSVRLFLGSRYVPLRKQFIDVKPITVGDCVKNVMFTVGSSDSLGITAGFVEHIVKNRAFRDIRFNILAGTFFPHSERLFESLRGSANARVLTNVTEMAEFIKTNDMAVAAAGFTLYELCALGMPILCYNFADNQIRAAKSFEEKGLAWNVGDYRTLESEVFFNRLSEWIQRLREDRPERERLSESVLREVDSRGSHRLAEAICDMADCCCENGANDG